MRAWVMPITVLSHEPFGPILGNGSDAFNGTFSPYQVRPENLLRASKLCLDVHHIPPPASVLTALFQVYRGQAFSSHEMGLWLQWSAFSR